jgi:hypothetical protein
MPLETLLFKRWMVLGFGVLGVGVGVGSEFNAVRYSTSAWRQLYR